MRRCLLIVLALILSICSPIITSTTTSTPGPMEDDLRDKLATFSQWIPKQKGIEMRSVTIRNIGVENGRFGVYSGERPISKGSLILKFPASSAINVQHAMAIPVLAELFSQYELTEINRLVLFLVFEKNVNPNSFWKPYIDILPTEFFTTSYFTEQELNELKGSPIPDFAQRRNKALKKKYEEISNDIFTYYPNVFKDEKTFSFDDFLWAFSIVTSRGMSILLKNAEDQWLPHHCIVPIVDFLNTGYPDEVNTFCHTSDDSRYILCTAGKDISPGSEILRSYSQSGLSNAEYLMDYGFAFEVNQHDKLFLPLPEVSVENKEIKMNLMSKLDPQITAILKDDTKEMKGLDLEYDKNLHEKSGFMTFLRLLMLSEKELSHKGQILEKLNKKEMVSKSNEKTVVDYLIQYLRNRLKEYPTTLEEDETILDDLYKENLPNTIKKKNAVIARFAEKKLIQSHIDSLLEYLKSFRKTKSTYNVKSSWQKDDL